MTVGGEWNKERATRTSVESRTETGGRGGGDVLAVYEEREGRRSGDENR